jgi:hypothetical protein
MLATIDWDALVTVVWASVLVGVGVTTSYALAILGGLRAIELGRAGRTAEAALYAIVGVAGVLAVIGAVVFGIVVVIQS